MTLSIHAQLVGLPREITDDEGTWSSSIYREPVPGPVELSMERLAGDGSANTEVHGTSDKAVCCHPLSHYPLWNEEYDLAGTDRALGPGSVGENWTIDGGTEKDVAIGDVFAVGTARLQVSAPRGPCWKQERRLGLPEWVRRTIETLRTGYYLRVLEPGVVTVGDALRLEERPHPELTAHLANAAAYGALDEDECRRVARRLAEVPELDPDWGKLLAKWVS